ncbi:MAG: cyclic nucleotide-binding domain-containing protein [Treponema sp.]|nr:cyclic nucleotide-binding domain-containing protein [Treponema sp.]
MPKPLQFRAGSLIYFRGDPANQVFILQKGNVNLAYQDIETGADMHDLVQPGEFFGVKSALGRYPREENAIALQDAAIMSFTVPEFEALAAANTRIIMKMLKVFSNQMRRIHGQVSSLMKEETINPEAGLFNVGQYYLKNKRYTQARYVFSRYLTYYPSGKNAHQAAKDLETAEAAIKSGAVSGSSAAAAPVKNAAENTSEAKPNPANLTDTAKAYYDAVSLISQQKYQQAYLEFKKIVETGTEAEYAAKSSFEIGRCLFLLKKYGDCIKYYTMMITKYPKHPDLGDALYYMGQSYEKTNNNEQAATFYKKILSMAGDPEDGTHVKAKRALKALEA